MFRKKSDFLEKSDFLTDPQGSNAAIERIREHDKPLADALVKLVKTYRFDIIQELFEGDDKKC
ncbi:hypothetical protein QUF90_10420 [Desulfococcaceae bacterium HSG9]|nr:hypothetical protein [Desulfococcaceae bacterium HSG9]